MPDAYGRFKPWAGLSPKAAATYERIFPRKCQRDGCCPPGHHVITDDQRRD